MNVSSDNRQKLQQLKDMFSEVSVSQMYNLCEENKWNVALCIDHLVNTKESSFAVNSNSTENLNRDPIDRFNSTSCKSNSVNVNFNYQRGAIPKNTLNGIVQEYDSTRGPVDPQNLIDQILAGYKVMVIMRGAPGSGKSYLATNMVKKCNVLCEKYRLEDFILSADDFFYDSNGRYKYNVGKLEDAHVFNQYRVREKAATGWSPIIVDNTNLRLWEMIPYVQTAVRQGYIIELMEPSTSWRLSAGKLAMKNRHRVTREKIQAMLDKYEKGTVNDLLRMLKDTKYTIPLPQMRSVPAILTPVEPINDFCSVQSVDKLNSKNAANKCNNSQEFLKESSILISPKPQRKTLRKVNLKLNENEESNNKIIKDRSSTLCKHIEEENSTFSDVSQEVKIDDEAYSEVVLAVKGKNDKTILDLLKEGATDTLKEQNSSDSYTSFEQHRIGCPNENKGFASLRQIYPNKSLHGLWDLFLKCNGDIDWAVDILLKEDELSTGDDICYYQHTQGNEYVFNCACMGMLKASNASTEYKKLAQTTVNSSRTKRHSQRVLSQRNAQNHTLAAVELKKAIENNFVLGEEHYSVNSKKLRSVHSRLMGKHSEWATRMCTHVEVQTDPVTVLETEEEQESDGSELLEISLGEELVKQLSDVFGSEVMNSQNIPKNLKTNVFMPKALAKELFILWVESAYNQIEDNRQNTLREDESFARLLKNPKYENLKESPDNIKELLDMELAWMIYKKDDKQLEEFEVNQQPNDIATHLTQMKLCDIFPNIPRETILDVFASHNYKFSETVTVLEGKMDLTGCKSTSQNFLLERAIHENELLNDQIMVEQQEYKQTNPLMHSFSNNLRPIKTQLQTDEAKRLALHDFEETRNFAAHHSQLKAECYQKAKEAIQRGNSSVAVYYSQIANLHKKRVDMYNHRAANCIMEVHKYAQNNPDLLDLHYLHVLEALGCLDLFVDSHITNLRNLTKSYKHVFIITGRGLHSAGGVSTIKNKVKSRLKERSLRWSEVNPGLLKVKIFSASRYSKSV